MISLFNYPPTEQQIGILLNLGLANENGLFFLRMLTTLLGIFFLGLWYKVVIKATSVKVAIFSSFLLAVSPSSWVLVWSYPILVFKLFLVSIFLFSFKMSWKLIIFLLVVVIGINTFVLGQSPAVLSKIKMNDAKAEVGARFMAEDSLRIKAELPLWWRRVGYNKYFIVYKELLAEAMPFFDLETLFFQEVHPMEQKSVVMFYWPSIILLVVGIYAIFQKNHVNTVAVIVVGLFLIAFVDYLFSNTVVYQRLIVVMLPLSVVMALGFRELWKWKAVGGVVSMVLLYGIYTNAFDLSRRADYWLDNRPLVYEFWYKNLKEYGKNNPHDYVRVSTLVGNSLSYCQFYLGNECFEGKYEFNSFDLSKDTKKNGVYLGFAGEFVGPKFKNDIDPNWVELARSNGIRVLTSSNIRDTVAYRYGNDIGLAEIK